MSQHEASGRLLIVEDEHNIASLIEGYLCRAGFKTLVAHDGHSGLEMARRLRPALVILDLMLPSMDGWEFCREIRKESNIPILILTAREEEMDRILGFSLGADDYVVKPFSPRELVERVKAILRRTHPTTTPREQPLRHGGLVVEPHKHKVTLDGRVISLTPTEFKILHTLMGKPGRVFTREELLMRLYSAAESVVDRVIDVHVGKLRQKIESDPSQPAFVLTVRGVGYRFTETDDV